MVELVLSAPQRLVEAVSELLLDEMDAASVSVEDADAGTADEQPLFGEPGMPPLEAGGWDRATLRVLFADASLAERAATLLLARDDAANGSGVRLLALRQVADQDWVRATQSQFEPVRITDRFWIVPSWHAAPAGAERVIRLDPGLAFGTGTHSTTRMCLRWIAEHGVRGRRVLDYGCGSGILAIAAALHGSTDVDAVDIDPAAIDTAQANAAANGVALRVDAPDAVRGPYGLVVANILASPLLLLAPLLSGLVAPDGWLLLAGMLERQADELAAAYAPWLALRGIDRDDGWVLMAAQRGRA